MHVTQSPDVDINVSSCGLHIVVVNGRMDCDRFLKWGSVNQAEYDIIIRTVQNMKRDINGLPSYLVVIK